MNPCAGAHGEMCGMMMVQAYHKDRGDKRSIVLTPDSAHGTNPASAAMVGYKTVEVKSGPDGCVDIEELKRHLNEDVAALMLTNPNTLGLFEKQIIEIQKLVHDAGALLYYDGANLNAIAGIARPGDMGFNVVHINLHKTFSTPHGGGGPGSGPVGVLREINAIPAGSPGSGSGREIHSRTRIGKKHRPTLDLLRERGHRFCGLTFTCECWAGRESARTASTPCSTPDTCRAN